MLLRLASAITLMATVVLAMSPHVARSQDDGPVRLKMIGHRGNGTGVFPDDCKPVSEWSEEQNVVWKTALPNLGNSSPICVGDRVFVTCEPGWKSDSPVLVCIDARDGEKLWQREIDPFELLPDEEQSEAQAWRAEYFKLWRQAYQMTYAARGASKEALAKLQHQAEELGIPYRHKGESWAFGHEAFWHGKTESYERLKEKYDFMMPVWHYAVAGMAHATPVSDGERIYVHTAYKASGS